MKKADKFKKDPTEYQGIDAWRVAVLGMTAVVESDKFLNQEVALLNDNVVGIFDYDIGVGVIGESETTYQDKDEWLSSLGNKVTIDQTAKDKDGKDAIVATDEDGEVVGAYVGDKGINIKDSVTMMSTTLDEAYSHDIEWLRDNGWVMRSGHNWVNLETCGEYYYLHRANYPGRPWGVCSYATNMCYQGKLDGSVYNASTIAEQLHQVHPDGNFGEGIHEAVSLSPYVPTNETAFISSCEKMAKKLGVKALDLEYTFTMDPKYAEEGAKRVESLEDKEFALGFDYSKIRADQVDLLEDAYGFNEDELREQLGAEQWFLDAIGPI